MSLADATRWLDRVEPGLDAAAEQTAGMTEFALHDGERESDLSYLYGDLMAEPHPYAGTPPAGQE